MNTIILVQFLSLIIFSYSSDKFDKVPQDSLQNLNTIDSSGEEFGANFINHLYQKMLAYKNKLSENFKNQLSPNQDTSSTPTIVESTMLESQNIIENEPITFKTKQKRKEIYIGSKQINEVRKRREAGNCSAKEELEDLRMEVKRLMELVDVMHEQQKVLNVLNEQTSEINGKMSIKPHIHTSSTEQSIEKPNNNKNRTPSELENVKTELTNTKSQLGQANEKVSKMEQALQKQTKRLESIKHTIEELLGRNATRMDDLIVGLQRSEYDSAKNGTASSHVGPGYPDYGRNAQSRSSQTDFSALKHFLTTLDQEEKQTSTEINSGEIETVINKIEKKLNRKKEADLIAKVRNLEAQLNHHLTPNEEDEIKDLFEKRAKEFKKNNRGLDDELDALQAAIDRRRPKETNEDRFEAMLTKLLNQNTNRPSPTPPPTSLSLDQLMKQLGKNSNTEVHSNYGSEVCNCLHDPVDDEFFQSPPYGANYYPNVYPNNPPPPNAYPNNVYPPNGPPPVIYPNNVQPPIVYPNRQPTNLYPNNGVPPNIYTNNGISSNIPSNIYSNSPLNPNWQQSYRQPKPGPNYQQPTPPNPNNLFPGNQVPDSNAAKNYQANYPPIVTPERSTDYSGNSMPQIPKMENTAKPEYTSGPGGGFESVKSSWRDPSPHSLENQINDLTNYVKGERVRRSVDNNQIGNNTDEELLLLARFLGKMFGNDKTNTEPTNQNVDNSKLKQSSPRDVMESNNPFQQYSKQLGSNNVIRENPTYPQFYSPPIPYIQPEVNKAKSIDYHESKSNDLFTDIVSKIVDKFIAAIPILIKKLFNFTIDDLSQYGDYYGQNGDVSKIFQSFGILGYVPAIIIRLLVGFESFFKVLKKNKFFNNFLLPALLLFTVGGSILFVIWWFRPESDYYEQYQNYTPQNHNNYYPSHENYPQPTKYPVYSRSYYNK